MNLSWKLCPPVPIWLLTKTQCTVGILGCSFFILKILLTSHPYYAPHFEDSKTHFLAYFLIWWSTFAVFGEPTTKFGDSTVHTRPPSLLTPIISLESFQSSFYNLLEGIEKLIESHFTHGYGLLQGRNTNQYQPKQKAHRAEFGDIPNAELSCLILVESGCITFHALMYARRIANKRCSPEPCRWASFLVSLHRYDWWINHTCS